jgi:hypothetical protein
MTALRIREFLAVVAVFGAAVAAGWMLVLQPEESMAKPKRPALNISCDCHCDTGQYGPGQEETFESPAASCAQLENRTCNREVPGVGIRSGRLFGCRPSPESYRPAAQVKAAPKRPSTATSPSTATRRP